MTQKPDNNESVLSRWSRRKLDKQATTAPEKVLPVQQEPEPVPPSEQQIVDETELPIWQQLNVDPEVKRSALSKLFRQPEFNVVDRMNEYDDDFTQFKGLGNVITQQMKHMLKLAEQKTRPGEEPTVKPDLGNMAETETETETETSSLDEDIKHVSESQNDNEDNEIA
tara:strand:+ start:161885 stop:162388 length:504 start_codon:yes stop_codon:yes gene_type:complete